jgi:hypothetical protein
MYCITPLEGFLWPSEKITPEHGRSFEVYLSVMWLASLGPNWPEDIPQSLLPGPRMAFLLGSIPQDPRRLAYVLFPGGIIPPDPRVNPQERSIYSL